MNSMFFDVTRVNDVDALLKMYGSKPFASPYRSTVPLVSSIKDDQALFEVIVGDCGISSAHSFHFEYKVTAPGSHGGPSQTDTMIFAKDSVLFGRFTFSSDKAFPHNPKAEKRNLRDRQPSARCNSIN
jgi:hypothetical protein